LIGICSLHNPILGKRIGNEQKLEYGVYQTFGYDFYLRAVLVGSLDGKERKIAISVLSSIT